MNSGGEKAWPGWSQEGKRDVGYGNINNKTTESISNPANYNPSFGTLDTFMVNTTQDDFTAFASGGAQDPALTNWLENLNPGQFIPAMYNNSMTFADDSSNISPTLFLPNNALSACQASRRTSREAWSREEDNFLVARRKEGRGFLQIAQEMSERFGGPLRSDNCLVKRLQKIQGHYLEPLPMAMKNRMPELLEILKDEMAKSDLEGVSGDDMEVLNQVMQDLPRILPKFVQNRVTSTRKALLNTSLSRT